MNKTLKTGLKRTGFLLLMACLAVSSFAAKPPATPTPTPTPTPPPSPVNLGSGITVDGNYNDWNLTEDFFADMHRAGKLDKPIESKLYLRYNCASETLFILVLNVEGVPALDIPGTAFFKNGVNVVVGENADPSTFQWIEENGDLIGWEGSWQTAPGEYWVKAHIQVYDDGDSQTSATSLGNNLIGISIDCSGFIPNELYAIGGIVFNDSDKDGIFDSGDISEPGIPGVPVYLKDEDGNLLEQTVSSDDGSYLFEGLVSGNYTVVVGDLPDGLKDYYALTTPGQYDVIITNTDSLDNNFGFALQTIPVFSSGTGKTIGYWKHQLATNGKPDISASVMQGYIDGVEAFYIPNPFQFNDADEFADANAVLAITSSLPLDLLKKQLLATEFNEVSGRGLDNELLQVTLLQWGEYLVASNCSDAALVLQAKDIFDAINNTGE